MTEQADEVIDLGFQRLIAGSGKAGTIAGFDSHDGQPPKASRIDKPQLASRSQLQQRHECVSPSLSPVTQSATVRSFPDVRSTGREPDSVPRFASSFRPTRALSHIALQIEDNMLADTAHAHNRANAQERKQSPLLATSAARALTPARPTRWYRPRYAYRDRVRRFLPRGVRASNQFTASRVHQEQERRWVVS